MAKVLGFKFETPRNALKQLQFAGSRALNDAAFDARKALITASYRYFRVRRKHLLTGYRVVRSRKGSDPVAVVGNTRDYLEDQVVAGRRIKTAVPSKALRGNARRVVGRGRWPRKLLSDGRHFVPSTSRLPRRLRQRRRAGERLLLRRFGRGGRRVRVAWVLRDRQLVKDRFPFEKIAHAQAQKTLPGHLKRRLAQALRTAR